MAVPPPTSQEFATALLLRVQATQPALGAPVVLELVDVPSSGGTSSRSFVFGSAPVGEAAVAALPTLQMRSSTLLDLVANRVSGPSAFMRGLITVRRRAGGPSRLPDDTKHLFQRFRDAYLELQHVYLAPGEGSGGGVFPPHAAGNGGGAVARPAGLQRRSWQPDTANCSKCGASFTLLFRRHHCRACGACVCAACSPHRLEGVRVCAACHNKSVAAAQAAATAAAAGHRASFAAGSGVGAAAASGESTDSRAGLAGMQGEAEAALPPLAVTLLPSGSSASAAASSLLSPAGSPPHWVASSAGSAGSEASFSEGHEGSAAALSSARTALATNTAVAGRLSALQGEVRALQEQVVASAVARLRSKVAFVVGCLLTAAVGAASWVWAITAADGAASAAVAPQGFAACLGAWLARSLCLVVVVVLGWPVLAPASPWGRRARAFLTTAVVLISLRSVRAATAGMRDAESAPVWDAQHAVLSRYIYEQLRDLRAFWLKVGQYLSARADVMPAAYVRQLSKLQDATAPSPFAAVAATVCAALGVDSLDAVFEAFDPEPLASASIAQVHRARLRSPVTVPVPVLEARAGGSSKGSTPSPAVSAPTSNSTGNVNSNHGLPSLAWPPQARVAHVPLPVSEVAVKVQHPGVGPIMRSDLITLSIITRVVAALEPDYDFRPVIEEWSREAIKELHFGREAALTRYAGDVLAAGGLHARVPGVVDIKSLRPAPASPTTDGSDSDGGEGGLDTGLASDAVLVMEFVHGPKITDAAALAAHGVDTAALMADVCAAFALTMLASGAFSGDPHGGNLLVELPAPGSGSRPRPVLLDFGLTKVLRAPVRLAFARMVLGAIDLDVGQLLDALDGIGLKLNREAPLEDLEWVQFTLRDTEPIEAARAKIMSQRAVWQERVRKRREAKQRRPFEAFPPDLLFFLRTGELLHGLGASLGTTFSYGKTMAATAALVLRGTAAMEKAGLGAAASPQRAALPAVSGARASVFADVNSLTQASVQQLAAVLAAGREAGGSPTVPHSPALLPVSPSAAARAALQPSPLATLLPLPAWARIAALEGSGTATASLDLHLQGAVTALLRRLWEAGELRGAQVAVYRRGALIVDVAAGERGVYDPRPVRSDTLFNCFSVTKGVLAALMHKLAEDTLRLNGIQALVPGATSAAPACLATLYDLPVTALWPGFVQPGAGAEAGATLPATWKASIRVRDVLTHTAGLQHAIPPNVSLKTLPDLAAMMAAMEAALPAHPPGRTAGYHYYTFGWLVAGLIRGIEGWRQRLAVGRASESASSAPSFDLSSLVREHIAAPLGLTNELQLGLASLDVPGGLACVTSLTDATAPSGGPGAAPGGPASPTSIGNMLVNSLEAADSHIQAALASLEADPEAAASDEANRLRAADALIKLLAGMKDRLFLLDPRLHNRPCMREGVIPASNGHFSARALARFYAAVGAPLYLARAAASPPSRQAAGGRHVTSTDASVIHSSPPPALLSLATVQAATRVHVVEERGGLAVPDSAAPLAAEGGNDTLEQQEDAALSATAAVMAVGGAGSREDAAAGVAGPPAVSPAALLGSHPLLSAMFGAAPQRGGVATGAPAESHSCTTWGLGWQLYPPLVSADAGPGSAVTAAAAHPFGHTGFGGSHAWYDPTADVAVAITVNQLTSSRAATRAAASLLADALGLVRFHAAT